MWNGELRRAVCGMGLPFYSVCDSTELILILLTAKSQVATTELIILKQERKNIFKMNKEVCCQKRANTSGVGKMNNYFEDIYIPPYH